MPAIPQSEVLAKCLQEIGEKCSEILANFFADSSFNQKKSRKNPRHAPKNVFFFTAATLGAGGPSFPQFLEGFEWKEKSLLRNARKPPKNPFSF